MPVWDIGSLSNMQMRICVHCTNSFISSKKGVITFYMLIYINNYYHTLEIFIDLLSTPMVQWSNDPMVQTVQNGPKQSKRSKMVQTVQNGPNSPKWSKRSKWSKWSKWSKRSKMVQTVQNGPNSPKRSKRSKMVQTV